MGVDAPEVLNDEEIEAEPVSELVRDADAPRDKVGVGLAVKLVDSDRVCDAVPDFVRDGVCEEVCVAVIEMVEVNVSGVSVFDDVRDDVGVFEDVAVSVLILDIDTRLLTVSPLEITEVNEGNNDTVGTSVL